MNVPLAGISRPLRGLVADRLCPPTVNEAARWSVPLVIVKFGSPSIEILTWRAVVVDVFLMKYEIS